MSTTAIALILVSAVAHAGWNVIGKARHPTVAYFLVATGWVALLLTPWLLTHPVAWTRTLLLLVVGTGVFQGLYFYGLAGAYRRGDVSVAYPLARAIPVVLVALCSIALGRGDQLGALFLVGAPLVAVGCLLVPLRHARDFRLARFTDGCCRMAVVAGIGTTGYSLIDDEGLRVLRDVVPALEATLTWMALQCLSTAAVLLAIVVPSRDERASLRAILRGEKLATGSIGMLIFATYGLVLLSMSYVDDVSYVTAFRQTSIPIGALLGVVLLGEAGYRPKILGVLLILVGQVLVALG